MKKNAITLLLSLFVISIVATGVTSCQFFPKWMKVKRGGWEPPHAVAIKSGAVINYSLMGWLSGDQNNLAAVLAKEGDLLSVVFSGEDEEEFIFPYHSSDGGLLAPIKAESGLKLGGRLVTADLSDDLKTIQWIKGAKEEELADLRLCTFPDSLPNDKSSLHPTFKKLSKINPHTGWVVGSLQDFRYVLSLFDPKLLIISNDLELQERDWVLISSEPHLEYLWFSAENLAGLKASVHPPKIRKLMVSEWDPGKTSFFLEDWESLKSLTIRNSGLQNLSALTMLQELEELHLAGSEDLSDISALSGFRSLKALNLLNCENVTELAVLKELKELKWLGLPPGASQDQFEDIIREHPKLRVLELMDCDNIKDLSPLRTLDDLESLVLLNSHEIDYTPLFELENLRFLALDEEVFKDHATLEKLRQSMPAGLIVQAAPFCMGSGWILLLWLTLPVAWFISHRSSKNKQRSA